MHGETVKFMTSCIKEQNICNLCGPAIERNQVSESRGQRGLQL